MVIGKKRLCRLVILILLAGAILVRTSSAVFGQFTSVKKETIVAAVTLLPPEDYVMKLVGPPGDSLSLRNGTSLVVPEGALASWYYIFINRIHPENVPQGNRFAMNVPAISAYELGAYEYRDGKKGKLLENLSFRKPVTLVLGYEEGAGVLSRGNLEERLRVFWRDFFDWRLVGGQPDTKKNTVTVRNLTHLSQFALFPLAFGLSNDTYRPVRKIITPSLKDGINDRVEFENLDGEHYTIKIYDITGKKIKTLRNTPVWDGTDDDGDVVESGIYIYQLRINGKVISGVIAVAK